MIALEPIFPLDFGSNCARPVKSNLLKLFQLYHYEFSSQLPVIKLDMISGRMSIFKSLNNISPGKPIIAIALGPGS